MAGLAGALPADGRPAGAARRATGAGPDAGGVRLKRVLRVSGRQKTVRTARASRAVLSSQAWFFPVRGQYALREVFHQHRSQGTILAACPEKHVGTAL